MMKASYWGKNFLEFFAELGHTLYAFCLGKKGLGDLASDEIQLLVLLLIGISCSLVGTFLVLRKMTMVANAISHTVLLGIVLAFLSFKLFFDVSVGELLHLDVKHLLLASFIASLLTMVLTDLLHKQLAVNQDASIGLVFSFLFALGIVLVSTFTRNVHIGVEAIMGNADMLHLDDLKLAFYLLLLNIASIAIFYKEYILTAFDSQYAKILGVPALAFKYLLVFQASATLIGAFRSVGVVLVLTLIVLPPLIGKMVVKGVKNLLIASSLISASAAVVTVALSRHFLTVYGVALSTSALFATILLLLWIVALLLFHKKKIKAPLPQGNQELTLSTEGR